MKFPNLHIVWTEGKKIKLPDLLSRSLTTTTQDEDRLRTVDIPESIKFLCTTFGTHTSTQNTTLKEQSLTPRKLSYHSTQGCYIKYK